MAKSAVAIVVGIITAIASAIIFGRILDQTIGMNPEATLGVIAMVVTMCALVSSTCAGCTSTWVCGGPYRWALVLIGMVVVAPDIIYAATHYGVGDPHWLLLPPTLAILATCTGLSLGGKLGRLIHIYS